MHCTPAQYLWLQDQARDPQLKPARLAELLLGSTADGHELFIDTFGCMVAHCQVCSA